MHLSSRDCRHDIFHFSCTHPLTVNFYIIFSTIVHKVHDGKAIELRESIGMAQSNGRKTGLRLWRICNLCITTDALIGIIKAQRLML